MKTEGGEDQGIGGNKGECGGVDVRGTFTGACGSYRAGNRRSMLLSG
jgi:hypothetical protein